ncbi:MAG: hypothetical protein ACJ73E_15590 [Mycobacteriales bacterium]
MLTTTGPAGTRTVDEAVLAVGRRYGLLVTNDLALGRRAANLSVRWLRTADRVELCVRTGRISADRGVTAVRALRSAGRLSALADLRPAGGPGPARRRPTGRGKVRRPGRAAAPYDGPPWPSTPPTGRPWTPR